MPPHDFRVTWKGLQAGSSEVTRFCELVQGLKGFATVEEPDGLRLVDACFQSPGSPVGMIVTLSEAGSADSRALVDDVQSAAVAAGIPAAALHMGGVPSRRPS